MRRKRAVGIVLCLVCAMGIINYGIDHAFYNPYHDISAATTTFVSLNQLLSPKLTESYLEYDANESGVFFVKHPLNVRMLKFSYSHNRYEPQNRGTIACRFGQFTLETYADDLNLGELTCRQDMFLSSGKPVSELESISDKQVYEVWVRFADPIEGTTFEERYGWLLNNSVSRPRKCGIMWIPVKTSDQADDICLGLAGNLSFHYKSPNNALAPPDFFHTDLYGREIAFGQSLEYLCQHPRDTHAFISTGLWQGAETINFEERYQYVQNNDFQYLGFVAYMKGSDLQMLNDPSLEVVALIEDARY